MPPRLLVRPSPGVSRVAGHLPVPPWGPREGPFRRSGARSAGAQGPRYKRGVILGLQAKT